MIRHLISNLLRTVKICHSSIQLFNSGHSVSNRKIKNVDGKVNTLLDY